MKSHGLLVKAPLKARTKMTVVGMPTAFVVTRKSQCRAEVVAHNRGMLAPARDLCSTERRRRDFERG